MNKTYIIGDPHFGHEGIIRHCNRPFQSVEEMDQELKDNWNNIVGKEDKVIVVGDFCFKKTPWQIEELVHSLNGHKLLVYGNHDKQLRNGKSLGFFHKVDYLEEHIIDSTGNIRKLVIFHYPILNWNGKYHGSWHAFGHSHGNSSELMHKLAPGTWDVGVDVNNFTPILLEDLALNFESTYKHHEDLNL